MKTEELTALGLNDEQVKGVFKLHGTAITALQSELGAANNTIKGLRDAAKKFEGVDVDKLRGDLEALQNKYDADVGAARLSGALDAALLFLRAEYGIESWGGLLCFYKPFITFMKQKRLLSSDQYGVANTAASHFF